MYLRYDLVANTQIATRQISIKYFLNSWQIVSGPLIDNRKVKHIWTIAIKGSNRKAVLKHCDIHG